MEYLNFDIKFFLRPILLLECGGGGEGSLTNYDSNSELEEP
jgi:hypothetical protein